MKTIFKKSLALAICVALCLTAFIGCLTVSAAGTATAVIDTVNVANGTASANVTVTITPSSNVAGARFDIVADATKVTLGEVADGADYTVETSTPATNTTRFVVLANDVSTGLASVTITLPYTILNPTTAGTIAIAGGEVKEIADSAESLLTTTWTDGAIVVAAPAHVHTPAQAVVENNVPATCNTAGSYDSVIYCSGCGDELSRETVNVPATGEHTAAAAVVENEVPATCGVAGSYDSVVYCSVCNTEISRETVNVPATGEHTWGEWVSDNADTHTRTCSVCGATETVAHNFDEGVVDGYVTTYTCEDCGYENIVDETPAVVEPILDPNLANTLNNLQLLVTNKVGFYFTFYLNGWDYDDFRLVVEKDALSNYNFTGDKVTTTISKDDAAVDKSYAAYGLYYISYSDIALYEMSLDVEYTLYLYKDGVATKYYTFPATSLSALANTYYTNNISNPIKASFAVDLLNMGTKAQVHFGAAGNSLTELPLPNASVDQAYATSYGNLTEVEGTRDSQITTLLQVVSAPSLWYTINLSSVPAAKTPANVTFNASYYSVANSATIEREVNGTELTVEEGQYGSYGLYYFGFDSVALYDADKLITLTVSIDGGSTYTHQYSVLSLLSTVVGTDSTTRVQLYEAVAAFAASTHNMWPTY